MMMTQCIPFEGETHFYAPLSDFLLDTILHPRPVSVRMPVIKVPRSAKLKYSDSELSSAARMLEKLKKRRDVVEGLGGVVPEAVDQEKVLDVVVERLIGKLDL